MTLRALIVTGADEKFAPLLKGLVESLQRPGRPANTELACLDVGLAAPTRDWLRRFTERIVDPEWDLPVAASLTTTSPHLRASTVRPFLPRYFPGFDLYLWMDSDTWVQEWYAIEWYLAAAAGGSLAIAPHVDRAYRHSKGVLNWRATRLSRYFGPEAAQRMFTESYLNAGVFALRGDAPHWAAWAERFREGLAATQGTLVTDQTALNQAVWIDRLPMHPVPAVCNWNCHLALPLYDAVAARFREPFVPYRPLGVIHLTGPTKDEGFALRDPDGVAVPGGLRFFAGRSQAGQR